MRDLGFTPPKKEQEEEAKPVSPDSSQDYPQYPSLRFNGEQAAKAGLQGCRFGEEYEIKIRVKATRIDGSYSYAGSGTSKEEPAVEFDVLACDEPTEAEAPEDDDPEEEAYEESKSNYRKPTVKGPEKAGMRSR